MPTPVLLRQYDQETLTCFHCHDVCVPSSRINDKHLRIGEKYFCCEGCKMVFEILAANKLCEFYDLDKNAGQSLKNQKTFQDYSYLEDPDLAENLIEFQHGQVAQVTFFLPQMHCVSCIWLLENLCKLDKGVTHSRVNFYNKTTTIQFNSSQTSLRKIADLLNSIGYAPDFNLFAIEGRRPSSINRRLAYQLGVAGFAFGNIMLFSFPEYVGMDREANVWLSVAFGYLSILLALPVLLFSARDYFMSAWQGLRKNGQLNIDVPLCLALLSLFGRSVWEITTHSGAGYLDSFAGLTFLLLIGKWFQQNVWHQLSFERDYKSYFPIAATVRIGGRETSVPVSRLIPGDIIIVRGQEIIPADGVLLKGPAELDYSFVTGEAVPVLVNSGEKVFAGGKQIGKSIEVSLTKRIAQSQLTKLWDNEAFKPNGKGQVTQLADSAGRYFTLLILAFGGGAFIYWWLLGNDMPTAINAFTAVMIVACPCNIALSIPFTLGNILRILGRHRFYLKNIRAVEAFSEVNAVVFDKTGTITNVSQQTMRFVGKPLHHAEKAAIRSLAKHSSHPLSRKLYESMEDVEIKMVESFAEMPGLGLKGLVDGQEVKIGSSKFVGFEDPGGRSIDGVLISIGGEILGHFQARNRLREGLAEVMTFFSTPALPGIFKPSTSQKNVFMLSGDHDRDAAMLAPFFPDSSTMHFNQSPQDKLDFVKRLQQRGQRVLMIGDGLNDAGALRQSDVGIVVAENTNNFTPACDAILHADEFARLPQFVKLARAGVKIVNRSYIIALAYNAVGLSFAVSGALSPLVAAVLMPLSSVSIVLFGVGMGNWAARKMLFF